MSAESLKSLSNPISIKGKLLMTAGITNMNPRIRAAMIMPIISYTDPQFQQILNEIIEGIRYVFQTKNYYSFAITGSTSFAFETAICNTLETDDKIMVVCHGVCGEKFAKISKSHGFKPLRIQVKNLGNLVEKEDIKRAVETHKPKLLFICHGDSSVGTLQPLRGIGSICHEYNCLFMVDVSATLCSCPLSSDILEIDILIAGTQYALGLSPGLSLLSFSTRAVDLIKTREKEPNSYYMNFKLLSQSWGLSEESKFAYHYTPSVTLLYALRESLAMTVEEGLDKMIERHMKCSVIAQKEISSIGLEFMVNDDKKRLTSVLTVIVPKELKRDAVVNYMLKNYDIHISKGISPIDNVWRIGIFGDNASRRTIKVLISVLKEAIEATKRNISKVSLF